MKIKKMYIPIPSSFAVFLFVVLVFSTSINAQNHEKEVMTAFKEANEAYASGDSIKYFSVFSPKFLLIHGGIGKKFDLDQSWQMVKRRGNPDKKVICEIVSMDMTESAAWVTYHYASKTDETLESTVNIVQDFKDYKWIGTLVFMKNDGRWQNVVWHTSPAPK